MAAKHCLSAFLLLALLSVNYSNAQTEDELATIQHLGKDNFTDVVLKDDYVWAVAVISKEGAGVSASKEFGHVLKGFAATMKGVATVGVVEVGELPYELLDSYSIDKTRMRTPMLWLFKRAGKVHKEVPLIMGPDGHLEAVHVAQAAMTELKMNESMERPEDAKAYLKVGKFNWHPELH